MSVNLRINFIFLYIYIYKRGRDVEKNLQTKKDSVPTEVRGRGKYSWILRPLFLGWKCSLSYTFQKKMTDENYFATEG